MKEYLLIFLFIFVQGLSKPEPVQIKFEYSNLGIKNSKIEAMIKKEFDLVESYFSNLLELPTNSDVSKALKKFSNSMITCQDKTQYKFKKKDIEKNNINLFIIPIFTINSKTKYNNNIILNECLMKDNKRLIIILEFEFKSEKLMEKTIPINFQNLNYQWYVIRAIISSLGFNKQFLIKKRVINNILYKDQKLLKKY